LKSFLVLLVSRSSPPRTICPLFYREDEGKKEQDITHRANIPPVDNDPLPYHIEPGGQHNVQSAAANPWLPCRSQAEIPGGRGRDFSLSLEMD